MKNILVLIFWLPRSLHLAPTSNTNFALLDSYQSFIDTRALMDLQLADEDYRSLVVIEDEKIIFKRECNLFLSQLKKFSLLENEFLKGTVWENRTIQQNRLSPIDFSCCFSESPYIKISWLPIFQKIRTLPRWLA